MFKIIKKSAGTTLKKLENTILTLEGHEPCTDSLAEYLDTRSLVAFSQTCKTTQRMSYDALAQRLLSAVVYGDETLAKKIVTAHPVLLLDASATVTDISGKEIKGLTPLQAAICASDVDMVHMIFDVLQHKLQVGIHLNFEPATEIQRQFDEIYPEGMYTVEAVQKAQAQAFKDSTLTQIFAAIRAATAEQINFELNTHNKEIIIATETELRFEQENPGIISERRPLSVALHNFRLQVAHISKQERIFNPFNLIAAFELYCEQYNNFNDNGNMPFGKKALWWRQVIGYIQRHLPAYYLQAFARGLYDIAECGAKVERTFEFKCCGHNILPTTGKYMNLGYEFAAHHDGFIDVGMYLHHRHRLEEALQWLPRFQDLLRTKNSGLEGLRNQGPNGVSSRVTFRPDAQ